MNTSDVANELGISTRTFRRYLAEGVLSAPDKVKTGPHNKKTYLKKDVAKWQRELRGRRTEGSASAGSSKR